MPSLSITRQHIAGAAGVHNGVVGEETGPSGRGLGEGVRNGRVGGILAGKRLISVGD